MLTIEDIVSTARCHGVVVQYVPGVGGLAAAAATQEHNGLVLTRAQHGAVGNLGCGINVGWHVLRFTPAEHLDHLQQGS